MAKIPAAMQSPAIIDGVIRWYVNDTFDLDLTITLVKEDGSKVQFEYGDKVTVIFYDLSDTEVYRAVATTFNNQTVVIHFNDTVTKKFPKGRYTYDVIHERNFRRTIAKHNKILVE